MFCLTNRENRCDWARLSSELQRNLLRWEWWSKVHLPSDRGPLRVHGHVPPSQTTPAAKRSIFIHQQARSFPKRTCYWKCSWKQQLLDRGKSTKSTEEREGRPSAKTTGVNADSVSLASQITCVTRISASVKNITRPRRDSLSDIVDVHPLK